MLSLLQINYQDRTTDSMTVDRTSFKLSIHLAAGTYDLWALIVIRRKSGGIWGA